jgi:hypothetical protein
LDPLIASRALRRRVVARRIYMSASMSATALGLFVGGAALASGSGLAVVLGVPFILVAIHEWRMSMGLDVPLHVSYSPPASPPGARSGAAGQRRHG